MPPGSWGRAAKKSNKSFWDRASQYSNSRTKGVRLITVEWGTPVEKIDTLVVGGGQAGIAMSEHLSVNGVPHLVLDVPCVDGSRLARTFFTPAGWSVQPCVRPVCAVHMTAGHNALRGSGPGQNRAFKDAMALMGCPDRRIDRLCITCCSLLQPSHHVGCPARDTAGVR